MNDLYARRFAPYELRDLPFYWGAYEPEAGKTDELRLRKTAELVPAESHRDQKEHPLCWHLVQPQWLMSKPPSEVESLQVGRIRRECAAFADLIGKWDVVNEAVAMPDVQAPTNPSRDSVQGLGESSF